MADHHHSVATPMEETPAAANACPAAGCDDYAAKPIRHGALLAMIARHVQPIPTGYPA